MSRVRPREEFEDADNQSKRVKADQSDTGMIYSANNSMMETILSQPSNDPTGHPGNQSINQSGDQHIDCVDGGAMMEDDTGTSLMSRITEAALAVNCSMAHDGSIGCSINRTINESFNNSMNQSMSSTIHSSMLARSNGAHAPGHDWWTNHYYFMGEQGEDE